MNEQLQAALADLLSKANSGIDAGATFLQAQLPDVIQQLLVWKMVSNLVPMIASGLLVVCLALAGWKLYQRAIKDPRIAAEMMAAAHNNAYFRSAAGSAEERQAREAEKEARKLAASLPNKSPFYFGFGAALGFTAFLSALCFASSLNLTWLQIWLAPKVYLIEYAASLAK